VAGGRHVDTVACFRRSVEINRNGSDRYLRASNLTNLDSAYPAVGRHDQATGYYDRAIVIARDIASPRAEAVTLLELGRSQLATGDPDGAHTCWHRALATLTELGDPWAERAAAERAVLGVCSAACGERHDPAPPRPVSAA
jgi:tetratricopeptide (TPR) repeat protein